LKEPAVQTVEHNAYSVGGLDAAAKTLRKQQQQQQQTPEAAATAAAGTQLACYRNAGSHWLACVPCLLACGTPGE